MVSADEMTFVVFFAVAGLASAIAAWWVLRAYRKGHDGAGRPAVAIGACALAAGLTLGLYVLIGAPGRPDAPYASRLAALKDKPAEAITAEEAVALNEQRAQENQDDPLPHFLIGAIYEQFGELPRAAIAYDQALRTAARVSAAPDTPDQDKHVLRLAQGAALTAIGRIRVAESQGQVSREAASLFAAAAELTPGDPEPWLFQAMAAAQAGEHERAVALWDEALSRTPPDHPMHAMAERMRARAMAGEAPRAPPPMVVPG